MAVFVFVSEEIGIKKRKWCVFLGTVMEEENGSVCVKREWWCLCKKRNNVMFVKEENGCVGARMMMMYK